MRIIRTSTVLAAVISFFVGNVQAQLDEQVPYQGDTLLTNPNQYRVTSEGDVLMDCDWPTMIAMIRDLEERIAGETEADTTYGVYVSGGVNGNNLNMWYDCVVLRDSIVSLQVAYDEVLAPRVTVDTAAILSDTSAALSASFSGSGVEASGFVWASDAAMTSPLNGSDTGTTSPIADTLTGLDAGTVYYFSAYAVKEAEYFYGDTLSLLTMPGITTEAEDELAAETATLNATFSADSITAQGFVWGLQADLSDGTSVSADTTGGSTAIEYAVSGLTPGTVHYFSAYATNASGTTYGDTLALLTIPGITTDAADELAAETATLNATFSADSITAQGFVWGLQADLSDGATVSADTTGGSTAIEYALTGLTEDETYYFSAYASNASGTTYGDTLSFVAALCGNLTSVSYQGYDYDIVPIGTQCWFAENLRNENYNDGSAIPSGLDGGAWSSTTDGAVTVFDEGGANEATNLADYGRLYNWHAVNTGNLCPSGWHVPTDTEWTTLETQVSNDADALKASASDSPAWDGTNTSGFSALAGGLRHHNNGDFWDGGSSGYFWSSSLDEIDPEAWYRKLSNGGTVVLRHNDVLRNGFSVRCVLD